MVDDLAYDAKSKRIYVTGSDFVDVFNKKMLTTTNKSDKSRALSVPRPQF